MTLLSAIEAGRLDDAATLALEHPVRWVTRHLSYDDLSDHAELTSEFIQRWLPQLSCWERLEAADWAAGQYVTAMVDVDHSYGIAARLLLEAQRGATAALAESLRGFWALTDGPDAETSPQVAAHLRAHADLLDQMMFPPSGHNEPERDTDLAQ